MERNVTRAIWCEQCCRENWDEVSALKEQGRVMTKGGVLKMPIRCRACDEQVPVGAQVEVITILGLEEASDWAREFMVFDDGPEQVNTPLKWEGK